MGKSNGEPRRVIDFQARETHHTTKLETYPVFDAWNGYYSVPEDTHFTHIHHCLGRPPGVQVRFDNLVEDVCRRHSDMVCGHDAVLWLTRCGAMWHHWYCGTNLNPRHHWFCVKPARKFTKAIAEFPDVCSWFGLLQPSNTRTLRVEKDSWKHCACFCCWRITLGNREMSPLHTTMLYVAVLL